MTPEAFIARWKLSTLGERQAAQPHFLDLCELLGEPKPAAVDASGADYCFEKGAIKTSGRRGWCDVWKRGHFAWEYKGKRADLNAALAQLQQYALALDNPPLLVACDLERFLIVTNWTNTVSRRIELRIEQLAEPRHRETLKWVLSEPDRLKPGLTRQTVTAEAAAAFAALARDLRARGHHPEHVAKFLIRLVFCMFAQNIGLLQNRMLTRMLEEAQRAPDESEALARDLFRVMATGGRLGMERVLHFDGGLFETEAGEPMALPMDRPQIRAALDAAAKDWAEIDPSIMGTLFVQGLDPKRMEDLFRSAGSRDLGSVSFRRRFEQYTDPDTIMKIIVPVIQRPLEAEWAETRGRIEAALAGAKGRAAAKAHAEAESLYSRFLDRIRGFRVLDPACGSGNFLFLALQTLKDIEHKAMLEAEAMGLHREFPQAGPRQLLGIEINPFAAELARASVWIGELQWLRRHAFPIDRQPILRPLGTIERRDALVNEDGSEAGWPEADVIVGNPPFLGGKLLLTELGDSYVRTLFDTYEGKVPREADLVCYWFAKARQEIEAGRCHRAGLVATNSIRGGANRKVLDRIAERLALTDAWDDEPWVLDGAAVRVSLVCFAPASDAGAQGISLDGRPVDRINPDLTAGGSGRVDLTKAARLKENLGIAFMGDTKGGAFDIPGELARQWLRAPLNPNGRPNSDVLRPWANGLDVTRRWRDMWIIDFGLEMKEQDAALYELPFQYATKRIRPERVARQERGYARKWWQHERPRPEMWKALAEADRYIVTPTLSKHRLFLWLNRAVVPDHQLIVIATREYVALGILHSSLHQLWSLRLGTSLEDRPRYTPSTTFETFPFPERLAPNLPASAYAEDPHAIRIAEAASRLNELRDNWLNPPDLVERVPEVVPGYPDRLLPRSEEAARELKRRTLTNLYNERPQWLVDVHRALDEAVAAAYGWPADLPDEEVLARLLALNQERAAAGR